MKNNEILLVNPWVADFAAYDLWAKPLGLLYIGAFIKKYDYNISLLDFMDREKWGSENEKSGKDGRGKYHKHILEKPGLLKEIPRNFSLYGAWPQQIKAHLLQIRRPSAILITSHMTYWYVGIQKSIEIIKAIFPDVPIILGGIYVTLCEDHAHQNINADYFIKGYGEKKTLQVLDALHGYNRNYKVLPDFDDSNFPPYYLYENLITLPLMTSRGCPNNCSYCATKELHPGFSRRSVDNLIEEVKHNLKRYNVRRYAFYDDALFAQKQKYIIPFLKKIIDMEEKFEFFSPNGLFAREIDETLARLMKQAGFKMIRLSLESSISRWQAASSNKVSKQDFASAVRHLKSAGFKNHEIEAYLIMGLPGQSFDDVKDSINFVYENRGISRLASYTPIPGTRDFFRAVDMGLIDENIDPLLTNNTIYSCATEDLGKSDFQKLKALSNLCNDKVRKENG